MKSLVDFIKEAEETAKNDSEVFTVYDSDGTVLNVFDNEEDAKKLSKDYEGSEIKKEKRNTVEK